MVGQVGPKSYELLMTVLSHLKNSQIMFYQVSNTPTCFLNTT